MTESIKIGETVVEVPVGEKAVFYESPNLAKQKELYARYQSENERINAQRLEELKRINSFLVESNLYLYYFLIKWNSHYSQSSSQFLHFS